MKPRYTIGIPFVILMILVGFTPLWATPPLLQNHLSWATSSYSQFFGKNKVTEKRFEWMLHKTDHFDIYYYPAEAALVPEVGRIIEEAYQRLSDALDHEIEGRTPIILYKSHNDFRQTNVTLADLTEGVGGFAEIFKHRVVIPFTGSRRELREVLFHELTHIFQYDIIYHKPLAHIYTGEFLYSPPLWFIEGMAEYFAQDMDSVGEMVLRSAVVTDELVPLTKLQDFSALGSQVYLGYKEGQSALMFLARKYGEDKIGSILQELRHSLRKNLDEAMKNVLGVSMREFDKQWRRDLRRRYYPVVSKRDMPDVFSKQLTHAEEGSYYKFAWSPSGDLLACITTEGGHYDISLITSTDGREVMRPITHLYRSQYEEIQIRGNGIAWSPDGDKLAFFARKEGGEVLFIYNLITKDLRKISMPFDSCWSPEWSPEGGRIAFVGLKDGQSDIYLLSLRRLQVGKVSISRVTRDIYDEGGITWNPRDEKLAYSSERGGWRQIVVRDLISGEERVLTGWGFNSISPRWTPDGKGLLFVSDMTGFNDIYRMEVGKGEVVRLVGAITGCFSPALSPDGKALAYVGYHDGRQDIYRVEVSSLTPEAVSFPVAKSGGEEREGRGEEGMVGRRRYRPKLMLDAIFTDFTMYSDGILRNTTQLVASDMMGNHRVMLTLMGQSGYFAPDFVAYYYYLGLRPDFGVGLYNYHTVHLVRGIWGDEWYLERNTGAAALMSYPFDRYRRLEVQLEMISMPFRYDFWTSMPLDRGNITYLSAYLIGDTVSWSEMGPKGGSRYAIGIERTLGCLGSDLEMTNYSFDIRRYQGVGRGVLAFRGMGAASEGRDNMIYYLGGIDTLRGYGYEDLRGSRMMLMNVELRVPLIEEIRFGWPVSWSIGGIKGIGFMDMGAAWYRGERPRLWKIEGRKLELVDLASSVGLGLRMNLGIFALNMDLAWRTNLVHIGPGPIFHFGLGGEF